MADRAQLAAISETAAQQLCLTVAAPVRIARKVDLDEAEFGQIRLQYGRIILRAEAYAVRQRTILLPLLQGEEPSERDRNLARVRQDGAVRHEAPVIRDLGAVLNQRHRAP